MYAYCQPIVSCILGFWFNNWSLWLLWICCRFFINQWLHDGRCHLVKDIVKLHGTKKILVTYSYGIFYELGKQQQYDVLGFRLFSSYHICELEHCDYHIHYYKNMVFMLLTSCLKWLYSQYLKFTNSLKWLNVSIMTKIKSNNVPYD
jgi:hypothetical protein